MEKTDPKFNVGDLVLISRRAGDWSPGPGPTEIINRTYEETERAAPGAPVDTIRGQHIYTIDGVINPGGWHYLITLSKDMAGWIHEGHLRKAYKAEPTEYGAMIDLFQKSGVSFILTNEEGEQQIIHVGGTDFWFRNGKFERLDYDTAETETEHRI